MSILGMGPFEILVVLLLAFIVLGPQRMIDATRQLGKTTRDLRHFVDELPSISLHVQVPRNQHKCQEPQQCWGHSKAYGGECEVNARVPRIVISRQGGPKTF